MTKYCYYAEVNLLGDDGVEAEADEDYYAEILILVDGWPWNLSEAAAA